MMRASLTAERLREVLDYDPLTGLFTWLVPTAPRTRVGSVAGGIDSNGYVLISVDSIRYKAHRLAWLHTHGVWPSKYLDHVNRNKADNRIANLRAVTDSENQQNRHTAAINTTSGQRGVSWNAQHGRWGAYLIIRGARLFLGRHITKESAVAARRAAELKHHPFSETSLIAKTMEALL